MSELHNVPTEFLNPVKWWRQHKDRQPDRSHQPNTPRNFAQARRSIICELWRNPDISTDELCQKVGIKVPTSEDRNMIQLMEINANLNKFAMCVAGKYHAIVSSDGSTLYEKYKKKWMETIHHILEQLQLDYERFCRFRDLKNGYTVKIIAETGMTDLDSDLFFVEVFLTNDVLHARVFRRLDFKDVAMILDKTEKLPPCNRTVALKYDEQTEAFLSKHEIFDRYDEQSDDDSTSTLTDEDSVADDTKPNPASKPNPYAIPINPARSTAPER